MIIFTEGELVLLCMRARQNKERELVREIVLCKHVTELCMHACEKEAVEREREREERALV